jgi:glycosyltransferase involved in cell wall biosynthesis
MNVLFFSRDYSTHDHRFLAAFAAAGHTVHYLRLERRGPQLEERPLPEGVQEVEWAGGRHPFTRFRGPQLVRGLRNLLKELQPDVIYAGPLHTAGAIAAHSGFHPLVLMSWGYDLLWEAPQSARVRGEIAYALERADSLIVDCQAVEDAAAEYGFPHERIVRFPWGIDIQQFSPDPADNTLRADLGWEDAFLLLHTRAWEPVYGVDTVARAFVAAAARDERLRLIMLGGGSQADAIQAIFAGAGLSHRVHFPGLVPQAELPGYFRAADLYLTGSHSDGSSVSLMEALATGLPALAPEIPGNREWINPGEHGWLFPLDDVEALAAAILQAADPATDLAAIGQAARARAEERADWSLNEAGIQRAYDVAREAQRA